MPRMRIDKLGSVGLNTDVWATMLEPTAWTSMFNMFTNDGSIETVVGETKLIDLGIKPIYHCAYVDDITQNIIISNGVRIRAYTLDGDYEDITPTTNWTNATVGDAPWTGGRVTFTNLNSVLVVNSATEGPFYWAGGTAKLAKLPGWTSTWRCDAMLAYKYYLVAINMLEGANRFNHKLRWSGSAAEGELPTAWTPALSNDAGDDLVGETEGKLIGGVVGRDVAYIVKEDGIYSMQHIGGTFIMQLTRLPGGSGTSVPNGFAEMRGAIAIFTADNMLLFDGQSVESMSAGRVQKAIQEGGSVSLPNKAQVFVDNQASTMHLLLVPSGGDRLGFSLMFNWVTNTWSLRKLNYSYGFDHANLSSLTTAPPAWDDLDVVGGGSLAWQQGESWDEQVLTTWDRSIFQPDRPEIISYESNDADTAWWVSTLALSNTNYDNSPKECWVERTNIPVAGADGVVMATRFWVEAITNIPVEFYIGGHANNGASVVWEGPFTLAPDSAGQAFSCRVTGRYLALKIRTQTKGKARVSSLTMEWQKAGER